MPASPLIFSSRSGLHIPQGSERSLADTKEQSISVVDQFTVHLPPTPKTSASMPCHVCKYISTCPCKHYARIYIHNSFDRGKSAADKLLPFLTKPYTSQQQLSIAVNMGIRTVCGC